LHFSTGSF